MVDEAIIDQQGARSAPMAEGQTEGTNLVLVPRPVSERMRHMDESVYDLSAESHLMRLAKVLLGDAGAGRLTTPELLAKLQHSLHGSHFFDLDRFYGAILGSRRRLDEIIGGDPHVDLHTDLEWEDIAASDDSYRSRMDQLISAIAYGATPVGMELAAEALLNVDCDVYESFVRSDRIINTWEDVEDIGTYGAIQAFGTYGDLEAILDEPVYDRNRTMFTVVPKRPITPEERADVLRVLGILKPAHALLQVNPLGIPAMRDVKIRDASADSSYWRINIKYPDGTFAHNHDPWTGATKSSLVNGVPRPVFTAYQGEVWTALHDIAGVSSYATDASDQVLTYGVAGQAISGVSRYAFPPDLAIADLATIMAGRVVSDGILVRPPYSNKSRGPEYLVPVITDPVFGEQLDQYQIDLTSLASTLRVDGFALHGAGDLITRNIYKTSQRMWVTNSHRMFSTTKEVVELRLASPKLINHVSLSLAKYPHHATFEAWDAKTGQWISLRRWLVTESMPQRIIHRNRPGDSHPDHEHPNHWMHVSERVDPILTHRVRMVLQRSLPDQANNSIAPVDSSNNETPYTLAIKDWDIGYRIGSLRDVPRMDDALGSSFAIGTSINSRGEPIVLEFHNQDPRRTIARSSGRFVMDAFAGHSWRCDANPTNRGVASLFLDLRDDNDEAQVIDGFDLVPIKSGPHINLYYADEAIYGDFEASDEIVAVRVAGGVRETPSGALRLPSGQASYIEVDHRELGFDLKETSWTVGIQFSINRPQTLLGATEHQPILEFGPLSLRLMPDALVAILADSGYDGWEAVRFGGGLINADVGDRITALITYDFDAKKLIVGIVCDDTFQETEMPVTGSFFSLYPTEDLRVGSAERDDALGFDLHGMFFRQGTMADSVIDVARQMESYTIKARPGVSHPDRTARSLLRFHESDRQGEGWTRFHGGQANLFEHMVWTPIPRDYVLQKGTIKVPTTKAKFWKLEFTNLASEGVSVFTPIVRRLKLHPPSVSNIPYPSEGIASAWKGLRQSTQVNQTVSYSDTRIIDTGRPSSLTRSRYITDVRQANAIKDISWLFGWQPWQIGSRAPRFSQTGVHVYDEFDIQDTSKLAYFVGLKQVRALRTDYSRDDDTEVIYERFLDGEMLEQDTTWNLDPGAIFGSPGATVTSLPYMSQNPVHAIQFAAMQSNATQILRDDGFRDPRLSASDLTDLSDWHTFGDSRLTYRPIEYAMEVSRNLSAFAGADGGSVGSGVTPVNEPMHPTFALPEGEDGVVSVTQESGGIESGMVSTSDRGMIHAAVRVTAMTAITNPLVLQVVGLDGVVLAEHSFTMARGETREETLSYVLGAYDRDPVQLWERRSIVTSPMKPLYLGEAPTATGEVPGYAPDQFVRVRLIQRGASTDTWKIQRFSLFDDGIYWEFSNDGGSSWVPAYNARSNPNAVVTFPSPSTSLMWRATAYTPNRHISSLQIRPWYTGKQGVVMGVPHRAGNVSSFDHTPPIQDDPEFKAWHHPVPRWWWLEGQRYPHMPIEGQPLTNPWSSNFIRSGMETLGGVTDEATLQLLAVRRGKTGVDGDGFPVFHEELPPTIDTAGRAVDYGRVIDDGASSVTDRGHVTRINPDPIIRPPLSDPTDDA